MIWYYCCKCTRYNDNVYQDKATVSIMLECKINIIILAIWHFCRLL
jgi:hypothetical protein